MSSNKIIHLNEGVIKQELKELVRTSVEETLNELLEQEAAELINAGRYAVLKTARDIVQVTMNVV